MQGHPEQAAQDLIQVGLEYLQRRRLHNLPGQPGPGLRHPHSEEAGAHSSPTLLLFCHLISRFSHFDSLCLPTTCSTHKKKKPLRCYLLGVVKFCNIRDELNHESFINHAEDNEATQLYNDMWGRIKTTKPSFHAKTKQKGKTSVQDLSLRGGKKVTLVC